MHTVFVLYLPLSFSDLYLLLYWNAKVYIIKLYKQLQINDLNIFFFLISIVSAFRNFLEINGISVCFGIPTVHWFHNCYNLVHNKHT